MKSAVGTRSRLKLRQHKVSDSPIVSGSADSPDKPISGMRVDDILAVMHLFGNVHGESKSKSEGENNANVEEGLGKMGARGGAVRVERTGGNERKDQVREGREEGRGGQTQRVQANPNPNTNRNRKSGNSGLSSGQRQSGKKRRPVDISGHLSGHSEMTEIKSLLMKQSEMNSHHFNKLADGQRFQKIEMKDIKSDVGSLNARVKHLENNVDTLKKSKADMAREGRYKEYERYYYTKDGKRGPERRRLVKEVNIDTEDARYRMKMEEARARENRYTKRVRREYLGDGVYGPYREVTGQNHSNAGRGEGFSFSKKDRVKTPSSGLNKREFISKRGYKPSTLNDKSLKTSGMEPVSEVSEPKSELTQSQKLNPNMKKENEINDFESKTNLEKSSEIKFFGNNTQNFIYSTEPSKFSRF